MGHNRTVSNFEVVFFKFVYECNLSNTEVLSLPTQAFNQINVFFRNDSIAQGEFLIDSISVENFD
jgi:hypothetical protein